MRFQVVAGKIGQNIIDDPLVPYLTGQTTSDGSSTLVDAGASFASPPIYADHLVVNVTAGEQTNTASIASGTTLNIDDDIFGTGTSGNTYQILVLKGVTGLIDYNPATDDLTFNPRAGGNNFFALEDVFPVLSTRYAVEVDIEDYEGGLLEVEDGTYGGVFTPLGTSPKANGNGTWTFYGIPTANDVQFIDRSGESSYTITGIRIYETSQVKWYLTDSEFTTEFANGTPASTKYFHDRCLVEITPSVADGKYGIQIEDTLLTINGGYIRNTAFAGNEDFGWTITNTGTGWAIASNRLEHTAGGSVGTNYAEVELRKTTSASCNYRISADVTGDSATVEGKDADGNYTTLGTLSTTLTFTGGAYTHLRFSLTEVDTGTLDNVVLETVQICPDLESYPICIADSLDASFLEFLATVPGPSTTSRVLDRWIQLNNDYTEKMYIGANIRFARYEDPDGEQYRDSDGRSTIVFSERLKVHECQIAPVPVWVHDWITWALRSTLTIDAVEFYPFDLGYSPNWDKRTANAPVVFDVAEQEQGLRKTLC